MNSHRLRAILAHISTREKDPGGVGNNDPARPVGKANVASDDVVEVAVDEKGAQHAADPSHKSSAGWGFDTMYGYNVLKDFYGTTDVASPQQEIGIGGAYFDGRIDKSEHDYALWERRVDAALVLMALAGHVTFAETRHWWEMMPVKLYLEASYYEKFGWALARQAMLKGFITPQEVQDRVQKISTDPVEPIFEVGDRVVVLPENNRIMWAPPHLRTPMYAFGKYGVIERYTGLKTPEPEHDFCGLKGAHQPLYRVRFQLKDIVEGDTSTDTVDVEIYQHWLERANREKPGGHMSREEIERAALEKEILHSAPTTLQRVSDVTVDLLVEKGIISSEAIRIYIEKLDDAKKGDWGIKAVVRCWTDPQFHELMLTDAKAAFMELGLDMNAGHVAEARHVMAVANTATEHNLIVCTLCSCYPREILGLPPDWYKSKKYRQRGVQDPRGVLEDFGTVLPDGVSIRVHDSTAEMRYIVIPMRPYGTDGWSKEELAKLVTRDALIGVIIPTVRSEDGI